MRILTHPFCVQEDATIFGAIECNWRAAGELHVGDRLRAASGDWHTVTAIEVDKGTRVYNFEVADNHNYFVGRQGLLVHNQCGTLTLRQLAQKIAKHAFEKHVLNQGEYPGVDSNHKAA